MICSDQLKMHYDVVNNQMFLISALDYLHKLAKNLGAPSESSIKKTSKSGEADGTDQKKKTARGRGTKRKTPDYESDSGDDEDFSPGKDEEAESEDEEDSEPDFSLNAERRLSRPSRPSRGNYVSS